MMTKPYSTISDVYDHLLRHVDYERWYRYLRTLIFRYLQDPQYILELGCGTGKFGAKFSRDDFSVFGMDNSMEMLKIAKSRAYGNFHIFLGDMRNFAVSRKFDFVFSVHDSMNYLLEENDLLAAFTSAGNAIHRDGIFMFDLTTEYNIRRYFDGRKSSHVSRGVRVTWDNSYDDRMRMVSSRLSVRRPDGSQTREEHLQRIYGIDEVKPLLDRAGLRLVDVFGDYTFDPPDKKTVMINYVARKRQ